MSKHSAADFNLDKKKGSEPNPGVIDMANARLRSRAGNSPESLRHELEEVRLLLDQGQSAEVRTRLTSFLKAARLDPSFLAKGRCALAMALEMQGRYRESLEAVSIYESPEARASLDDEAKTGTRVQTALAYNYTGNHPKAIALLNTALHEASETASDAQIGIVYVALARVYRSISEFPIARDHAHQSLAHFRHTGDWRGLAESYFGIAMAELHEGNYEPALDQFEQALKLIGDHPATHLLGNVYTAMAGACWFLRRPHHGIGYLEKAISCYEQTEHRASATSVYNNLGINLILVGQWDRAQEALERALALATELEERSAKLPMVLDSLGELRLLRGDFAEAKELLERAVNIATGHGNKWYAWQPLRTLGRWHLAMSEPAEALAKGQQALALGEEIGDRQAICEARLVLAEAHLQSQRLAESAAELQLINDALGDSSGNLAIPGDVQRLHGMLALAQGDHKRAAHHFGRSVSIYEMLRDPYRSALAHYWLGRAYAVGQPERAAEHFSGALHGFQKLGASLDLARAEESLAALDYAAPRSLNEAAGMLQLLTLRLTEAVVSRELLLRELAAVIREEATAQRVLMLEPDDHQRHKVVIAHGWTEAESQDLAEALDQAKSEAEREHLAVGRKVSIVQLRPANALPATLLVSPRDATVLPGGLAIDSLLRVVEIGLDNCAFRVKGHAGSDRREPAPFTSQSPIPGFIHSSPAMERLVEETHKIRSSDVTVLVTGESGTGKELVARTIHAHSSRRSKVFVPFNCTAVPRELSDAFLFGYNRGAFTGAVADSPGVIRAAAGGTLFLDEVGDLPLEIQPKLLRFLQEGEIQPLGEQRPIKVDVRIIAATNSDLEEMVAGGRFREDLYYRLNVIRLKVPPLRERRSEIPTIVNYYLHYYSEKFSRRDIQISPQTVDLLMVCDWPGNVRQLTNEIQRIVARGEDGTLITPDHLSPELRRTVTPPPSSADTQPGAHPENFWQGMLLPEAVDHLERLMITEALRKHGGNISRAARELGMTRRGLQLKLGRYNMNASE